MLNHGLRFVTASPKRVVCVLAAVYVLLCLATIRSLKPWCDEGFNASSAMNLVNHGHLGVSSTELVTAEAYPDLDRHWYWQMPLYPVALAGWFGQGIYQPRLFTLFHAVAVLLSTYFLLRRPIRVRRLPAVTIAVPLRPERCMEIYDERGVERQPFP